MYSELRQSVPPRGTHVFIASENVRGTILRSDFINQTALVENEYGQQSTFKLKELEIVDKKDHSNVDEASEQWAEDIDMDLLSED